MTRAVLDLGFLGISRTTQAFLFFSYWQWFFILLIRPIKKIPLLMLFIFLSIINFWLDSGIMGSGHVQAVAVAQSDAQRR
jgi:hypothetical protein